jgi:signal transduction histidine kinase
MHTTEVLFTDAQSTAFLRAEAAAWRDAAAAREAMLATMPDGIALFEVGDKGRLQYANAAVRRLLGISFSEIGDLEPPAVRDAVRQVARGLPSRELTFETAGRMLEASVTETAEPRSALLMIRDVTAARRTDQLRRNFVANASHELKTPVASILGLASALERAAGDDAATRRFVAMMHREADRLSSLVSDLLDLSRLEGDAGPLEPVRLDRLVLERCRKLRAAAEAAGIRLTVRADAPVDVLGRATDLAQMADNLLSNAIRYTPAGGVVDVVLIRDAASAVLTVADTGIGIPPDDLGRVFERFYRVDVARDRETGGTGLGLAIVRHVAETHGGEVGVDSRVGEGSTFVVRLPITGPVHRLVDGDSPVVQSETSSFAAMGSHGGSAGARAGGA